MREKIVAAIFVIAIMGIPAVTLASTMLKPMENENENNLTVEEEQERADAFQNREEQLALQEQLALADRGTGNQEVTSEESDEASSAGEMSTEEIATDGNENTEDAAENEEKGGFSAFKESVSSFAKNLAFIEEAAKANNAITSSLSDDAYIDSDQVLAGKDKWLFYKRADDGTSMGDYMGTSKFSEKTTQKIVNNLTALRDELAARDITFVTTVIPNKELIYYEYMPSTVYRTSEVSRCDKLYEYICDNTDLKFVYPKGELYQGKSKCLVYHKYDTHWNPIGSYIGTQAILRELYGTYVDVANVEVEEDPSSALRGLADMIGMTEKYSDDTSYKIADASRDPSQIVDDDVLIIGDSFSVLMVQELDYYFDNVTQIGVWQFDMSMLDKYQPDVVIWECVERYADRLHWIDLMD